MIEYVKVKSPLLDSIETFYLRDEYPENGFLITNMSGIGPGEGDIKSEELALTDGALYKGSKIKTRDMVLTVLFIENSTDDIESLRHKIVKIFPVKKQVELLIKYENKYDSSGNIIRYGRIAYIKAYIKAVQNGYFEASCSASVTMTAFDPYYESYDINTTTTPETWTEHSIETTFEFGPVPAINYNYLSATNSYNSNDSFTKASDINSGYKLVYKFTNNTPTPGPLGGRIFICYNITDDNSVNFTEQNEKKMILYTSKFLKSNGDFPTGMYLVISSDHGKKSIMIKENPNSDSTNDYSVLKALDYKNSDWLEADVSNKDQKIITYSIVKSGNIYIKDWITNIFRQDPANKSYLHPRYYGV